MNAAICDDNKEFADRLDGMLREYCADRDLEYRSLVFHSSHRLLDAELDSTGVLFLDIDMPGLNGIETAKLLRLKFPDLIIIFITGWLKYAPSGYQVSAFRYLLKDQLSEEFLPCMEALCARISETSGTVTLKCGESDRQLLLSAIVCIEGASGRNVKVHLTGGGQQPLECRGTLSELEKELLPKGFLRIQRSYLLNMRYIRKISNYHVYLATGEVLRISRRLYTDVRNQYALWRTRRL